jgi:hypothetical protein
MQIMDAGEKIMVITKQETIDRIKEALALIKDDSTIEGFVFCVKSNQGTESSVKADSYDAFAMLEILKYNVYVEIENDDKKRQAVNQ